MAVHHLYQRAFIELGLAHVADMPPVERSLAFWTEIMALRDLFKVDKHHSPNPFRLSQTKRTNKKGLA